MCAIFGLFATRPGDDLQPLRRRALELSQRQRHRGPDWHGIYVDERAILVHERLAIIDPASGSQPLRSADGELILAANAEIYNHRELSERLTRPYTFLTRSDCEVINALYREAEPVVWLNALNGIFALVLWDRAKQRALIARDPIGVCSLYWGHDAEGRICVASEMKTLVDVCSDVAQFPPGHVYDTATGTLTKYYVKPWRDYAATEGVTVERAELHEALEQAVRRQMMADVPYGVLLSGGLDSSLVAACAMQATREMRANPNHVGVWLPDLHSFAIGLEDSTDLAAAEIAAAALGTIHHGFRFSMEEGLDVLPDVIRHVESYDVPTVRASTPMYLLARRIKAMGVKMVLSGEGADEIFGGYLYFHKAPNAREFHDETVRKLEALHGYDCVRVNKAMLAWGVEARVPFLDVAFLDVAMRMDARAKMTGPGRIEKAILREAFAGVLPDAILWRQKEQFSDGVGYGWRDGLTRYAEREVSDREFARAQREHGINPPQTKEAALYRRLFDRWFPGRTCASTVPGGLSVACSTPVALAWDPAFATAADTSGRAIADVHHAALTHSR